MPSKAFWFAIVMTIGCGSKGSGSGTDASSVDAGIDANPDAPTCVITGPAQNSAVGFDVDVALTATASDPQDGPLSGASIVWRTSLQVAPLGSGATLTTRLPVGSNLVTCTATDSTQLQGSSDPVTITSKSPYAKINHPGDNETRPQNQAVPFVGLGRDLEDGSLTGTSLVWTSNLDGQIGTGENFSKTLSAGVHTITLTATDSASNADAASITLTIQ